MSELAATFPEELFEGLFYHQLEIRFSPTCNIDLEHWIGSVIRNNLLYSTSLVEVGNGKTLYDIINEFPLPETHSLYRELSGGFPKGYALTHVLMDGFSKPPLVLSKDRVGCFSISLIGGMARYHLHFIEAIKKMCSRGIGNPRVPLTLIDISEVHPFRSPNLLYTHGTNASPLLKMPVYLVDFLQKTVHDKSEVLISFTTPVNLVQNRKKKNRQLSFQDKQNGFPSFYQFTRSVVFRMIKYAVLYGDVAHERWNEDSSLAIENWILQAAEPFLVSVGLERVSVRSTPKKEKASTILFRGYTGSMKYYGSFGSYLPVLFFAQSVGAGNDVTYGMGEYTIKIRAV